jgi:hypothetical protein
VLPASSSNNNAAQVGAAPIPVTPARAERDAIAQATRAQAARQSLRNTDADIEMGRRVSAALHAPPSIPTFSINFLWAVGVTTEGQILAANPYGIGYIPDSVFLPKQVLMVSTDESIPASTRGRWVNDPYLALLGWTTFHGKDLRVVFGTEEDFERTKFGSAATALLQPDDIPANGAMTGRTRLEVLDPQAAATLAAWPDHDLLGAVPPQPIQLIAPDPKEGEKLWGAALTPLLRTTGTNAAFDHLSALLTYSVHAQHEALYRTYTAPYTDAQRAAIADVFYWQHMWSLLTDALNPELAGVSADG